MQHWRPKAEMDANVRRNTRDGLYRRAKERAKAAIVAELRAAVARRVENGET